VYSARALAGKKRCKLKLQQDLNLEPGKDTPLFGIIARLANQKGLDLILAVAEGILYRGGQIALLGTGEKMLEAAFRDLGARHPGWVAAVIGYDEGLSHRIEAGSDMFLMPSRFEPCGLNQLYSLRYGTVPIVHATGGLKDTVEDGVTGFVFHEPNPYALWVAVDRALHAYADNKAWQRMMRAGMNRDFSWEKSAREYAALYRGLLG
jgi:starch synthase